jgi:hypothetical protein
MDTKRLSLEYGLEDIKQGVTMEFVYNFLTQLVMKIFPSFF